MHQDTEEHYKHKNIVIAILEKALDDICPKFLTEPPHIRKALIQERKILFAQQEKQIDLEWKQLVKEAKESARDLRKQRTLVISKIEKTRRKNRIKLRLRQLKLNKKTKFNYFKRKFDHQINELLKEQKNQPIDSRKFANFNKKIETAAKHFQKSIDNLELKYEKVVNNTNNTNNDDKVNERILKARLIWDREKEKLEKSFEIKEDNFIDKRLEFDCIRVSTEDFVKQVDLMKHYCLMIGITDGTLYKEVKERLKLLGRKSLEIEEIIKTLE